MRVDGDSIELNSWGGAICSLLLMVILSAYFYQKLDILINKDDQQILETHIFRALTDDDSVSYDNGFNIAVAMTYDDNDPEPFNDPTFGQIIFNHYKWGQYKNGTRFSGKFPI